MHQAVGEIAHVYEIVAPGGVDANASKGSKYVLAWQHEVSFPGGIRPEYIRSDARVVVDGVGEDARVVRVTTNPCFAPS